MCDKFKVGDRVKLVRGGNLDWEGSEWWKEAGMEIGNIYIIDTVYNNENIRLKGFSYDHCNKHFIKIGDTMSKYENIKYRIEALDDGWNKEADDVMNELHKQCNSNMIFIPMCKERGSIHIIDLNGSGKLWSGFSLKEFPFISQCDKMSKFKDASLWLLDHSDIKKDEKADKIKELESQLGSIQNQIDDLK